MNIDKITTQLKSFAAEMEGCNRVVLRYSLQEVIKNAPTPTHLSATDDFADMPSLAQDQKIEDSVQVKFKVRLPSLLITFVCGFKANMIIQLYAGPNPKKKNFWYPVTPVKSDTKRVPKYRFHHVQIAKNILTPNTMLKFLPHLRDLRPEEEPIYAQWTQELQNMDSKTGLASTGLDPVRKAQKTKKDEQAAVIYGNLDRWIQRLGLQGCNMPTLIRYMASQTPGEDDAITPQQKSSLLESNIGNTSSPHSQAEAKVFTDAFNGVFGANLTLDEVLRLDETVDTFVETNKKVKDTPSSQKARDDQLLLVENTLATYACLGCLMCSSHDCEHGEYGIENEKHHFSIDDLGGLRSLVKKKWVQQTMQQKRSSPNQPKTKPCKNQCWMGPKPPGPLQGRDWTESEVQFLKSTFAMLGKSRITPECVVASVLERKCWEAYEKGRELCLALPEIEIPPEPTHAKSLMWYDRHEKVLKGDWQECTISHEHSKRLLINPCHHDGPCSAANKCPCVMNKLLCERFCQCTADCCPYKFTGCACHSLGKTCLQRLKEGKKPCICVQLNRECDPVLCTGCGANERADPLNAHDDELHSTGCQNVALQRGLSKPVLMGESQLDGCGYGLFAAADISQDEYVIEYTGELISHDEGVRREARRGNVFDETSNSSYLFTLLDTEGIWVDAAIYGNLSRYINHAGDGDKKGANVTPKILYVTGEFRIRFTAMRDIKCGEELFFNYGENFPNLTKKLLEDKDAGNSGKGAAGGNGLAKRKPGRPPGSRTATKTASSTKGKQKEVDVAPEAKPKRGRGRRKAVKEGVAGDMTDGEQDEVAGDEEEEKDIGEVFGGYRSYLVGKADDGEDADGDWKYRRPATATKEDTDAYTLARDRRRRANAGSRMGQTQEDFDLDPSPEEYESHRTGKRPAKKRGGARPGAGRKRKNPQLVGDSVQNSPASAAGNTTFSAAENIDSDDEPLIRPRTATHDEPRFRVKDQTPPIETPSRRGGRARKRKASEIADTDDEYRIQASSSSVAHGSDEDEDDDSSGAGRKSRKRRKPKRYAD